MGSMSQICLYLPRPDPLSSVAGSDSFLDRIRFRRRCLLFDMVQTSSHPNPTITPPGDLKLSRLPDVPRHVLVHFTIPDPNNLPTPVRHLPTTPGRVWNTTGPSETV